jgi:sugar phosphate isomerase/epimerase
VTGPGTVPGTDVRLPVGLTMSGTSYSMGLNAAAGRTPLTARGLMDRAVELGLGGIEPPAQLLAGEDLEAIGRYAADAGLFVVVDTGGYDPEKMSPVLDLARRVGASTVRTVIGGARIGGDRRPLAGRWQPFLNTVLAGLRECVAAAERAGVTLAVENHQDLASEELLWLCESIGSDHFGLTLDTANPLATAEEPLDFFRRVAPVVRNVHLKDYQVWPSDEGYRLVRCAVGDGLTDFPALLDILGEAAVPGVRMSLEIGALQARHIRVLADDFWPDYPPRTAAQLAAALRVVRDHERTGDWRTPLERDEPSEAVVAYEEEQLAQSVRYLSTLFPAGDVRRPG